MIILDNESLYPQQPQCATIGFFDGVHCGHQALIGQLTGAAKALGQQSMAITFANHPKHFFHPESEFFLLNTQEEKAERLSKLSLDHCLMLNFDAHLACLTSHEFMTWLHTRFHVNTLFIGYDHHFGSDSTHGFDDYQAYGATIGVRVIRGERQDVGNDTVSSSMIRKTLMAGNIVRANELLGYHYRLKGCVVQGHQVGRMIGFPTANIKPDSQKLIPCDGVYATRVMVENKWYVGMLNIGNNPTLNNQNHSIEVHIIDFSQDLYGKTIEIEFVEKIRSEQRFNSLDELRKQIETDRRHIVACLNK
ncbi:MAG: bifunctional riboflavin kinase/FAD synthetase [Bacteroidales bacterium]|nr:bifunctional riboflavin kinase/FAD synthetase [Bacteroidales bacterium]